MALTPGTRLGPYEIVAALGAGGMGEVYRARDTKLNRDVAIKVLPDLFASDAERLARFTREAQALASLSHPNIAIIHGLEQAGDVRALVMELVPGEDLSQRIARGAIPIDEALPIAKQIVDALEAAHEQGIIHRDLKPANIKLRPDGTVKVLDFGLAKALAREPGSAGVVHLSQSPTITSPAMMTGIGMILGTAAYMAPEQAKGRPADTRSDIWAFGCVLYEMLTGRAAFEGEGVPEILSRVLQREPDWTRLAASLPPSIPKLLRLCLRKDVRKRRQTAADVRIDIEDALVEPVAVAPHARGVRLAWIVAAAVSLVALALAIPAVRYLRGTRPSNSPEMRLEVTTPPTTSPVSLAISPDGQKIVFSATDEGRSRLLLRSLDSTATRPLAGADGASLPFWSPDNRSVGFFADGQLKRIDIDGGSVQTLANAPAGRGGAWNRDGTILFAPNQGGPIFRIPSTGGEPAAVTRLELQQASHRNPWFLPDGRHFLYNVTGTPETRGVYVGQLGGSETQRLLDADEAAVYASSSGQLLFGRQETLFAQGFDPIRLALKTNPSLIAENVAVNSGLAALSASDEGTVVYRTGSAGRGQWQFAWFDRSGKELGKVGEPDSAGLTSPSLAPDGRHVAMGRTVNGHSEIWLLELGRGVLSRFTFGAVGPLTPVWSPDGSRIAFNSNLDLYQRPVAGAGSEELLLATAQNKTSMDISSDGRFLLYRSNDSKTSSDIWALPLDGDRKPVPLVRTSFDEREGQFSPDGNWIAYQSNESGRFEIYVQPFPGPGGKTQISTNGGGQVRWRRDGKELFYIARDGRLMAVPIGLSSKGQSVEAGRPLPLFATRLGGGQGGQAYMVSPDGQRFLMNTVVEEATSSITVILNWKPPAK